jgi:hypothetical protein
MNCPLPSRRVLSLSAAAVVGLVIGLAAKSWRQGLPLLPGPARRQALVEKKLREVLPVVEFRQTPFDQAIDRLRSLSGAEMVVEWEDLDSIGVRRDIPIDLRLHDVTLDAALNAVVGYADSSGRRARMRYTPYDGAIVISTSDALEYGGYACAAVYDLSDIQGSSAMSPTTPPIICFPPKATTAPAAPGAPAGSRTRQETDDELVRLIEEAVAPDIWDTNGGSGGFVRAYNGRFVVVTTIQYHRQIQDLVSQLRQWSKPRE